MNFNIDEIKKNIADYSTIKLCEMVISCRYLNLDEEIIILCMTELGSRRSAGDDFKFENFIDEKLKELPEINLSIADFKGLANSIGIKGGIFG